VHDGLDTRRRTTPSPMAANLTLDRTAARLLRWEICHTMGNLTRCMATAVWSVDLLVVCVPEVLLCCVQDEDVAHIKYRFAAAACTSGCNDTTAPYLNDGGDCTLPATEPTCECGKDVSYGETQWEWLGDGHCDAAYGCNTTECTFRRNQYCTPMIYSRLS
jgi:hypothetical protein